MNYTDPNFEPPLTQHKPDGMTGAGAVKPVSTAEVNWRTVMNETVKSYGNFRNSLVQLLNERQHAPCNSHTIQFTEANTDWKQIAEFRAYALDAANAEIDRLRNDVARLVEAAKPKVVTLPTKGELLAKAVRVEADSYWTGA